MKKHILLIAALVLINGCRYINTNEKYIGAQESQALTIPAGVDAPNSSSTLEVPKVNTAQDNESADSTPPEMPFRTRQSDSGGLRIINEGGYPVLTVKTEKTFIWEAMNNLDIENWSQEATDETNCLITLKYVDKAAEDRKNANFIKKMFTRDRIYTDYSGLYDLSCSEDNNYVNVKFAKHDGGIAKTFIADNVMNKLYEQFE